MNLVKYIAAQLREPTGIFGRLFMGYYFNRKNFKTIKYTINLLKIKNSDHILDIGFGGGLSIQLMLPFVRKGYIAGIDISQTMVKNAQKKFAKDIAKGLVKVEAGSISNLPYKDEEFDKVTTIHTIYFLPDLARALNEIYRVLRPGGCIAIAVSSKLKMQKLPVVHYGFELFSEDEIQDQLKLNGFTNIQVTHFDQDKSLDSLIVIGHKG